MHTHATRRLEDAEDTPRFRVILLVESSAGGLRCNAMHVIHARSRVLCFIDLL